ncbi:precorrin-4 C(11)-methyltransferase [Niameybacter massiliensis]|uniref:Precorrin-4 C(11)-methyltransferase n=1 Tax=Holtiella tumoricola TaxID=3018743 RepID=A0AA42DKN3_9FIRM|nr:MULTISPECIES: precorrin-4 C(11)-methyltransferase [Lachnospirales]MDA3730777.1 precorrin-4 C(11)-methyltransferase [Holtiella tumoricola]
MIYFVGAGPGDIELITVKGQRLLKTADLVIYAGSLVNPALLNECKEECIILDSAMMTLEEVIKAMVEEEMKGEDRVVVRLHTGDPSIYGAIREQMDLLDERTLKYEVVPGVSSFCGAAAALKKEYTLPNVSQTVILTRMEGRTPMPPKEELSMLASHQATMIIFLSVSLAKEVEERLIKGGYREDTPIAIVYKATWPEEKIYKGELNQLSHIIAENHITKTALIVVGDFLGDTYERSKLYDPGFTHMFREAIK